MSLRPFILPALLSAAAALGGCAGAATHFHVLDAAPAASSASAYAGAPIRVDVVHIPALLDRPELVHETAPGKVSVSDIDHWAAPLGEMMRRTLTQDLLARMPAGAVIFPDAPKPPGADGVVVDILSIGWTGGGGVMDVSYTVLPGHIAGQPQPDRPNLRRTVRLNAAGGGGVGAQPGSISALLGLLADRIAADLSGA